MDQPDEQKTIHVNPDFLAAKNKGQNNARVHVNPAFLNNRAVQPKSLVSNAYLSQGLYPGFNSYISGASNISSATLPGRGIKSVEASANVPRLPPSKSLQGTNVYKYERSKTLPPNASSVEYAARPTNTYKVNAGKPPQVPNRRLTSTSFRPAQQYANLYSKNTKNARSSPYSWTASKGPSADAPKLNFSSTVQINTAQQKANENYSAKFVSDNKVPEVCSHSLQKGENNVSMKREVAASKGSSILVNPKLLQTITSTSNPLLTSLSNVKQQSNLESTVHLTNVTKPLPKKETPKKSSKFKVISRTKLVRRQSSGGSSSDGSLLGLAKKSHPKNCASPLNQCSLKFPIRVRKYSTSSGLKKRYLVKSRTKLIRQLSGAGTPSKDSTSGTPKYSLKTKTKLVRRRSNSSVHSDVPRKTDGAANGSKSSVEKGAKFCVLSKTKLVRRRSSQALTRSNALVRTASAKPVKCWSSKVCGLPQLRNVNNVYKVVNNSIRLSLKQKTARGIISKYKINRLKSDSAHGMKPDKSLVRMNTLGRPHPKQRGIRGLISKYKINRLKPDPFQNRMKTRFKLVVERNQRYTPFRRRKVGAQSDHIINIGGILYKSTKMSLRKQQAKTKNLESDKAKTDSACIVHLRGDKFQVSAGGRTLKRVSDTPGAADGRPSLSRVHIGGLTYSRTANGQYELTKVHQARAVLSSAKQRSVLTLSQRRKRGSLQKRNEYCMFFNRFGRCSKKEQGDCPYIHDPKRVAICTRFLRGRCPVSNCPFSHIIDPDKMPVCSHFVKASCTRDNCPYRHVRVNPSAPVCLEFLQGHCTLGEECKNQHILICEEFSSTGVCPRGTTCPLSHHRSRSKRKKSVSLEPAAGHPKKNKHLHMNRKRKGSESLDVLGGPTIKRKAEKRSRLKVEKVPQKRYFHVSDLGSDGKADTTQNASADLSVAAVQPNISREPESAAVLLSSVPEEETEDGHPAETSPSVAVSRIEETRKRILGKIEKMKQTASNLKMDDTGVLVDKSCEKQEAVSPAAKRESDDKRTEEDGRMILAQRPPLPKRLPSYIPLSMDGED